MSYWQFWGRRSDCRKEENTAFYKKGKTKKDNVGNESPRIYNHHHSRNASKGEENEEINGDGDDVSVPLSYSVTQTVFTSPTFEINNSTSASGGKKMSKSTFLDPKILLKSPKKRKGQKSNTKTPAEEALQEANGLLASGAW